jgi:hypothetical protein
MKFLCTLFSSPKILKIVPINDSDTNKEESLSIKQDKNKLEQLSLTFPSEFELDYIPSPCILPFLSPIKQKNITSFYSSYDYLTLYRYIYKILSSYDPYFDRYEHYWLITNKKYRIHTSIKISMYKHNETTNIVECYSMDKDDIFWKIYHLLKKKCNNVKENILDAWENDFDNI